MEELAEHLTEGFDESTLHYISLFQAQNKPEETGAADEIFSLSPNYMCETCNRTFSTLKGKNQHIGKVHQTKYKRSRCKLCKRTFRNKYTMHSHIRQVHQGSAKAHCDVCNKTFYTKYVMANHKCKKSKA